MTLSLRTVTSEDLGFLFHLHEATLRPYVEQIWGWDADMQRQYHQDNFQPGDLQIIQYMGKDIGMVSVLDKDDYLFLARLEILPRHQKRGIGSQILRSILQRAVAEKKSVMLRVFKINPAYRLYDRFGFEVESETDIHYIMRWDANTQFEY